MPFPYSITDFVNEIPNVLLGDTNKIPSLPALVARAIIQRYSADSPKWNTSDIEGNGTNYIPLPVSAEEGEDVPVWESNFSVIAQLEFPIGQQPPQLIDDSDFRVYHAPGVADKILLNFDTPASGDFIRCSWSSRHLPDGSTVPDRDFYAVVDYAASLGADVLASWYVSNGDATIGADVVNYRTKSQEAQAVAKMLRKRYYNHMGIEEGDKGEAEVGPAFSLGNQYLEQNSGVDRLVHGKYTR